MSGFPVSSSKSSSICFPLTPPLALISSVAISMERFSISPNFACEPVRGSSTPTLTVSAANPVDAAMTSDRIAATTTNALPTVPFMIPSFAFPPPSGRIPAATRRCLDTVHGTLPREEVYQGNGNKVIGGILILPCESFTRTMAALTLRDGYIRVSGCGECAFFSPPGRP